MQKPSDIHEAAEAIYRLQRGATTRGEEAEIRAILLGFRGAELTRLKNLIGDRTDRHDLEGLLYYDIDDESVRAEILAHFAAVAAKEASDEVKVLCDIDDTLVCRLHDDRYPRGTVYPGAVAFLEALDQGPRDAPFSTGDLTFITARPADAFGLIETYSRAALAARDLGLMSERGLATVIDRSRTELRDVAWESGEQRDATTLIVARDIAAAEAKYRPTPDAPRPDAPAPERRGPADRG